jgi:hypothetical protein
MPTASKFTTTTIAAMQGQGVRFTNIVALGGGAVSLHADYCDSIADTPFWLGFFTASISAADALALKNALIAAGV